MSGLQLSFIEVPETYRHDLQKETPATSTITYKPTHEMNERILHRRCIGDKLYTRRHKVRGADMLGFLFAS